MVIQKFLKKTSNYIRLNRSIRMVGIFSVFSLVLISSLSINPIILEDSSAEATSSNILSETYLNMELGYENANLALSVSNSAGTFASSSESELAKFNVVTNNYTGYTLYISGSDDEGDLTNTDTNLTSNNTIASIESAIDSTTFNTAEYNGKWGYLPSKYNSLDNTDFQPAPTPTGSVLDSVNIPNAKKSGATSDTVNCVNYNCNEYTIGLGARVDYNTPSGTYTNTFTLIALANPVGYIIEYNKNTEDTVTDMPTVQAGNVDDTDVTISSTVPKRDGYVFIDWCDETPTITNGVTSCSGNTYQPGDVIILTQLDDSNSIDLYAEWRTINISDLTYMQDFANLSAADSANVINSMTLNSQYQLKDSRDNQTYTISRISPDGEIWMTKNLNIAGGTVIDSTKSNVPEGYTLPTSAGFQLGNRLPASSTQGFDDMKAFVYNDSTYGGYYSYPAITAGTDTDNYPEVASSDICPKGWRLPTKNEYESLVATYSTPEALSAAPWNSVYGGRYWDSKNENMIGTYSPYWTSTGYNLEYSVTMSIYTYENGGSVRIGNTSFNKESGLTARCVAKNLDITVSFNANGGTGTMADQTTSFIGDHLNFNTFTREGYSFAGWNTKADGSGTTYLNIATYSGPSTTLYAQWVESNINTSFANAGKSTVTISGKQYYKMQDMTTSICNNINTFATGQLADTRDNKVYNVTKMGSNCWMTQNLNLAGGTTLTSTTSNVSSSYTLPASNADGSTGVYNNSAYGGYYDYPVVSAGTKGKSSSYYTTDTTSDICPKGWKLPSKDNYESLASSYPILTAGPWYGAFYGGYSTNNNGSFYDFDDTGFYWTATVDSERHGPYRFIFRRIDPSEFWAAHWGALNSVRCIAKQLFNLDML